MVGVKFDRFVDDTGIREGVIEDCGVWLVRLLVTRGIFILVGRVEGGFKLAGMRPAKLLGTKEGSTFEGMRPAGLLGGEAGPPFEGMRPAKLLGSKKGSTFEGMRPAKLPGRPREERSKSDALSFVRLVVVIEVKLASASILVELNIFSSSIVAF